jgi:hypothetical protein
MLKKRRKRESRLKKKLNDSMLPRWIYFRMHDRIGEKVAGIVRESSFSDFINILEEYEEAKAYYEIPLQIGKIRDAIIHLLDLHVVDGIDGDLMLAFRELEGHTIQQLRDNAIPIASDLLARQVKKGNTFFLGTEEIATSAYAHHVGDIIDARQAEIAKLGKKATIKRTAGTFYGYQVILNSMLARKQRSRYSHGIPEEASQVIAQITGEFGTSTKMSSKYTSLGDASQFKNCSVYQANLLSNMLRALFAKRPAHKEEAVSALGQSGDLRASDVVMAAYRYFRKPGERASVIRAIGRIGGPDALPLLRANVKGTGQALDAAIYAIGNLGTEEAFSMLLGMVKGTLKSRWVPAASALGFCSADEKVDEIEECIKIGAKKDRGIIRKAIQSLIFSGPNGRRRLTKNFKKYCNDYLKLDPEADLLLKPLAHVPEILTQKEYQELVALRLETAATYRTHRRRYTLRPGVKHTYYPSLRDRFMFPEEIIKELKEHKAIWESHAVRKAIAEAIKAEIQANPAVRSREMRPQTKILDACISIEGIVSSDEFQNAVADLVEFAQTEFERRKILNHLKNLSQHQTITWNARVRSILASESGDAFANLKEAIQAISDEKGFQRAVNVFRELRKFPNTQLMEGMPALLEEFHQRAIEQNQEVTFALEMLSEGYYSTDKGREVITGHLGQKEMQYRLLSWTAVLEDEVIGTEFAKVFSAKPCQDVRLPWWFENLIEHPWFAKGLCILLKNTESPKRMLAAIALRDTEHVLRENPEFMALIRRRKGEITLEGISEWGFGDYVVLASSYDIFAEDDEFRTAIAKTAVKSRRAAEALFTHVGDLYKYDDVMKAIRKIAKKKSWMNAFERGYSTSQTLKTLRSEGVDI